MPFQCHQESAQFNSISVLLSIIFKHNFKKLLNSLEFFLFNKRGPKTFWAILSFVVGYQNFLKDHVGVPKLFARCFRGSKNFFNSSKSPSALVPGIRNDYSQIVRNLLDKHFITNQHKIGSTSKMFNLIAKVLLVQGVVFLKTSAKRWQRFYSKELIRNF